MNSDVGFVILMGVLMVVPMIILASVLVWFDRQ